MLRTIERAGFRERLFNTGEKYLNYVVGPNNGPALMLIPGQALTSIRFPPAS